MHGIYSYVVVKACIGSESWLGCRGCGPGVEFRVGVKKLGPPGALRDLKGVL